jgi:hypothetical protein
VVFEFNQHGESPTANLDRTVVADALRSIILGREGSTLNREVVIEVLPLIDATCGRGFRSSRCPTSWLPGMTRSPQDNPTTLFPPFDSVIVGQDEDRWHGSAEGRRYLRLDIRIS